MDTKSKKSKVKSLLNSIESGAKGPMGYLNSKKFIQHNLSAADGIEGFSEIIKSLTLYPEAPKVNIVRAIEDGDYVITHTEYNFFGEKIGFDIFRFEGELIVEHWDNLQGKLKNSNPSGRSMTDGKTEIDQHCDTESNREIIEQFAEDILINGNYNNIGDYFNGDNYIQHNPEIGDGLSTFMNCSKAMYDRGVVMSFDKIHRIFCEKNFALVVSEGMYGSDGGVKTSYYDLFRLEGGKIAEHWDVIESITQESERRNKNGKFGF